MKKPKGLKSAEKKLKSSNDFDLNKLAFLWADSYSSISDMYPSFEDMMKDEKYQSHGLMERLCHELATASVGFSHASDILDDSPDRVFAEYAGVKLTDADDSTVTESEIGPRWERYDDVKEHFKQRIDESMNSVSLTELGSFSDLYKVAKKKRFKGNEADFERLLKTSQEFREFCKSETTRYSG